MEAYNLIFLMFLYIHSFWVGFLLVIQVCPVNHWRNSREKWRARFFRSDTSIGMIISPNLDPSWPFLRKFRKSDFEIDLRIISSSHDLGSHVFEIHQIKPSYRHQVDSALLLILPFCCKNYLPNVTSSLDQNYRVSSSRNV